MHRNHVHAGLVCVWFTHKSAASGASASQSAHVHGSEVGEDLALHVHLAAQQPVQQLVDVAPAVQKNVVLEPCNTLPVHELHSLGSAASKA